MNNLLRLRRLEASSTSIHLQIRSSIDQEFQLEPKHNTAANKNVVPDLDVHGIEVWNAGIEIACFETKSYRQQRRMEISSHASLDRALVRAGGVDRGSRLGG